MNQIKSLVMVFGGVILAGLGLRGYFNERSKKAAPAAVTTAPDAVPSFGPVSSTPAN